METFVILLIMAAVSFFNWLIKRMQAKAEAKNREEEAAAAAAEATGAPQQEKRRAPGRPRKTEAERLREFMEALGVPKEKLPGPRTQEPPAIPRQAQPTPPPVPVQRQPTRVPAAPKRRPVTPPPREVPSPQPALAPDAMAAASTAARTPDVARDAYRLTAAAERADSVPAVDLGDILRTRSGFRSAVLMREILGPPKSLRTQEELPGFL